MLHKNSGLSAKAKRKKQKRNLKYCFVTSKAIFRNSHKSQVSGCSSKHEVFGGFRFWLSNEQIARIIWMQHAKLGMRFKVDLWRHSKVGESSGSLSLCGWSVVVSAMNKDFIEWRSIKNIPITFDAKIGFDIKNFRAIVLVVWPTATTTATNNQSWSFLWHSTRTIPVSSTLLAELTLPFWLSCLLVVSND